MQKNEKFAYDIEMGACMDYIQNSFCLVIKDQTWNKKELKMMAKGGTLNVCYTNGLIIFVLEMGDIDSSDFYFNIQECEDQDQILACREYVIDIILLDEANEICWQKKVILDEEQSRILRSILEKQAHFDFMPGEYDVNVSGIQEAYEPFELEKFSQLTVRFQGKEKQ